MVVVGRCWLVPSVPNLYPTSVPVSSTARTASLRYDPLMRVLKSFQQEEISDAVRAKFAMVAPVLEATLLSVSMDRIKRLGGYENWTLTDLAREFREGSGDAGICFEYAVHEAIAARNEHIWPLASEVIEKYCNIPNGLNSILFGPEKNGRIPILESVEDALTDDSRVYVGNAGHPPKLKRYIPKIIRAFHRHEDRNKLPRSINGLWKADLFLGNPDAERWVGTTVKVQPKALEGARGLRIGIYPKRDRKDVPRKDADLNLIRLPLPYDASFMELYYKSFFLVRAFLKADAKVPTPPNLPDAEDRFVTQELEARASFPIYDVLDVIREMAQPDLLTSDSVKTIQPTASLSEGGLMEAPDTSETSDSVSLAPEPADN